MVDIFGVVVSLLLGFIAGSFLNVVIIRLHTGKTIVLGRSACMTCNKTLAWWELIPVLSYIFLRGKCSSCRSSVSLQYISVEALTGVLFSIAFFVIRPESALDFLKVFFAWMHVCLLLVLAVYDIRHRVILDGLLGALLVVSVFDNAVFSFLQQQTFFYHLLWQCIYGFLLAIPFYGIWRFSNGRAMGFGDVKFAAVIGFLFGNETALSALLVAFYVSFVWVMCVFVLQHVLPSRLHGTRLNLKSEVPFGPFLSTGVVVVYMTNLGLQWFIPMLQLFALYTYYE